MNELITKFKNRNTSVIVDLNESNSLSLTNIEITKIIYVSIISSITLLTTLYIISKSNLLKSMAKNVYATNATQGFYSQVYEKNIIYYLSLILGSVIIASFSKMINSQPLHLQLALRAKWFNPVMITVISSLFLILAISDSDSWSYLYLKMLTSDLQAFYLVTIALTFLPIFFGFHKKYKLLHQLYSYSFTILLIFIGIIFFRNFLDGFSDLNSVKLNASWNKINFNATFHSVAQTNLGQLPLIDYFAQYGYYSYLLRPIFILIPLTLTTYVGVMGLLAILFFFFLHLAVRQLIRDRIICLLTTITSISLISIGGTIQNLYLANLPIRYIWPSIGFFLLTIYSQSKNKFLYYSIHIICILAMIWNLDTGVVLTIATLLFFSYEDILEYKQGSIVPTIMRHWILNLNLILVFFTCYGLYAWYTRGIFPKYAEIIRFQILFFDKGIMASPIKLFSPWITSCIVYIFAIAFCFNVLFSKNQKNHAKSKLLLFLALYGLGTFSYFIMRGHLNTFYAVSWPAIILAGIFVNYLQDSDIIKKFVSYKFIYFILLLFLTTTSISLIPRILETKVEVQSTPNIFEQRLWAKSLNINNKTTLILSDLSGILHMDTQTISPLLLPGATEIILKKDINTVEDYLTRRNTKIPSVLVDKNMIFYNHPSYKNIREKIANLKMISKSPDGCLIYYSGFAD